MTETKQKKHIGKLIEELEASDVPVASYPEQHHLTKDIRSAANSQGKWEYLSLWSGQGVRMNRQNKEAADLVKEIDEEASSVLRRTFQPT